MARYIYEQRVGQIVARADENGITSISTMPEFWSLMPEQRVGDVGARCIVNASSASPTSYVTVQETRSGTSISIPVTSGSAADSAVVSMSLSSSLGMCQFVATPDSNTTMYSLGGWWQDVSYD